MLGDGSHFGVLRNATDVKVKQAFIATCFEVMTDGSAVSPIVTPTDIEFLTTMDFNEAVAILCVKEKAEFEEGGMGDHWVAIVGRDDDAGVFQVACSYTNHSYGLNERQDAKTGRFYNTTIKVTGINKSTSYPDNINIIQLVLKA